jgi:hypothetical protein
LVYVGGLPQMLRAWDLGFRERCGLDGNGPAAHHHGIDQPTQVMVPRGPIEGMPQLLSATEALEPWRREPLVLDAWVAQQSVGAGQGTAKRRAPLVPADAADPDHLSRREWPPRRLQALTFVRHEAGLTRDVTLLPHITCARPA